MLSLWCISEEAIAIGSRFSILFECYGWVHYNRFRNSRFLAELTFPFEAGNGPEDARIEISKLDKKSGILMAKAHFRRWETICKECHSHVSTAPELHKTDFYSSFRHFLVFVRPRLLNRRVFSLLTHLIGANII